MTKLFKFDNVLEDKKESYEISEGLNLAEWMIAKWPNGLGQKIKLYKNFVSELNLIDATEYTTKKDETIYLLLFPEIDQIIQNEVTKKIISLFYPVPAKPEIKTPKKVTTSNNSLNPQGNAVRTNERIPDIVGKVRSYPDIIYPSISEYTRKATQKITEFFIFGVGDYEIESARNGDSLLTDDDQTTIEYFYPSGGSNVIGSITEAYEIETARDLDLTLGGQLPAISEENVTYTLVSGAEGTIDISPSGSVLYSAVNPGDCIQILNTSDSSNMIGKRVYVKSKTVDAGKDKITVKAIGNFSADTEKDNQNFYIEKKVFKQGPFKIRFNPNFDNDKAWFYTSTTYFDEQWKYDTEGGREFLVVDANNDPAVAESGIIELDTNYSGSYPKIIDAVDTQSFPTANNDIDNCYAFVLLKDVQGPFYTPIDDASEIWINLSFPDGIDSGTCKFEIILERDDGADFKIINAATSINPLSYKRNTTGGFYVTEKIKFSDHGLTNGRYKIYIRKYAQSATTDTKTIVKNIYAVKVSTSVDLGNVTAARVTTERSTTTKSQTRKFNAVVTRKLKDYTHFVTDEDDIYYGGWYPWGPSAAHTGAEVATQKWINAFCYRALASDGLGLTANAAKIELDIAGLKTIQTALDALDSGEGGEFNHTFDSEISADDELKAIARIARCEVYRIGSKLYCGRDQLNNSITALFNRRNKSPKGDKRHFDFDRTNFKDHIEITFKDSAENYKTQTFVYPAATDSDYDASYTLYNNALKVEPEGITNFSQAWRYAMYLYRSDKFQRDFITFEATDDARVLGVNDKILNVDCLEYKQLDGELLSYDDTTPSATVLTLDQPVFSGLGGTRYIKCRSVDGKSVSSFSCTKGADDYKVIVNNTGGSPFVFSVSDGISKGTLYEFRTATDTSLDEWIVKEVTTSDDYTKIKAIKYNSTVYDCDTDSLPTKPY